jgi:hypothetical protein
MSFGEPLLEAAFIGVEGDVGNTDFVETERATERLYLAAELVQLAFVELGRHLVAAIS